MGYEADSRDRDTCGKRECALEAQRSWRADDEEARYRAELDNYDAYR